MTAALLRLQWCYTLVSCIWISRAQWTVYWEPRKSSVFACRKISNGRFLKINFRFWTRWHITLGTWFRDYIFYPVSMSKPLKRLTVSARKRLGNHFGPLLAGAIALFCVWICNGLWHGSGWKYIFFGMYHFAFIFAANILEPAIKACADKLHINRQSVVYHSLQVVKTTIIVCFGELFFRAHGLWAGLYMFRNIFTNFSLETFKDGSVLKLGMDIQDFIIVLLMVLLVFAVGVLQERGVNIRDALSKKTRLFAGLSAMQ